MNYRTVPGVTVVVLLACLGACKDPGEPVDSQSETADGSTPVSVAPVQLSPREEPPLIVRDEAGVEAEPLVVPENTSVSAVMPVLRQPDNLLLNADFAKWPAESHVPSFWSHAWGYANPDEAPSTLERIAASGDTYLVSQTWKESDSLLPVTRLFGQALPGLRANATYRLEVEAENESKNRFIISAWELDDFSPERPSAAKAGERVKLEVVEIPAGPAKGPSTFSGTFTTKSDKAIRLGVKLSTSDPEFPGTVVWHHWRLTEAESEVAHDAREKTAPRTDLFRNGDFDKWLEGDTVVPAGWSHAWGYRKGEAPSSLERVTNEKTGDVGVKQTWKKSDSLREVTRLFGQTVTELEPNTRYVLEIRAENLSDNEIVVSAWDIEGYNPERLSSGELGKRLHLRAVTLPPKAPLETYRGSFKTSENGTVRLGAKIATEKPILPGSVTWYGWSLRRAEEQD